MTFSHALEDGYEIFWTSCFPVLAWHLHSLHMFISLSLLLLLLFFCLCTFKIIIFSLSCFYISISLLVYFSLLCFLSLITGLEGSERIVHECPNVCNCCSLSSFSPLIFSKSYTSLKKCCILKIATWNLIQETWRKGSSIRALLYTENIWKCCEKEETVIEITYI